MNTLLAKQENTKGKMGSYLSRTTKDLQNVSRFRGQKKTYEPLPDMPDDQSMRANVPVAVTVDEQLSEIQNGVLKQWLEETFAIEATNSLGAKRVPLIVDGNYFGELSAIELLRLKSFLTTEGIKNMFSSIPVRQDDRIWNVSENPDFNGRSIFETEMLKGTKKTSETFEEILQDPNVDKNNLPSSYRPAVTKRLRTYEQGRYTVQDFSGEWSRKQKADLLERVDKLLDAVVAAMKDVNDVVAEKSNLDTESLMAYMLSGKQV